MRIGRKQSSPTFGDNGSTMVCGHHPFTHVGCVVARRGAKIRKGEVEKRRGGGERRRGGNEGERSGEREKEKGSTPTALASGG